MNYIQHILTPKKSKPNFGYIRDRFIRITDDILGTLKSDTSTRDQYKILNLLGGYYPETNLLLTEIGSILRDEKHKERYTLQAKDKLLQFTKDALGKINADNIGIFGTVIKHIHHHFRDLGLVTDLDTFQKLLKDNNIDVTVYNGSIKHTLNNNDDNALTFPAYIQYYKNNKLTLSAEDRTSLATSLKSVIKRHFDGLASIHSPLPDTWNETFGLEPMFVHITDILTQEEIGNTISTQVSLLYKKRFDSLVHKIKSLRFENKTNIFNDCISLMLALDTFFGEAPNHYLLQSNKNKMQTYISNGWIDFYKTYSNEFQTILIEKIKVAKTNKYITANSNLSNLRDCIVTKYSIINETQRLEAISD